MKNYYEALRVLKETAESDVLVNTVTNSDNDDLDLDKKNLYPIVDIVCTGSKLDFNIITFSFLITAVDIRDYSNSKKTDKFTGNDNKHDNLNSMLAVLNRIYKTIALMGEEFTITNQPTPEPLIFKFKNTLDGWQMTLDIETPNTEISIC